MFQKILLVILSFMLFSCTNGARPKADGANRDITIYYIHRDHCEGCSYMDKIIKDKEIEALLSSGFKLVVVDVNNQEKLPSNLAQTRTTPTFYFVDSSNRKVAKDEHVLNQEQFKQKLLELKRL